MKKILHMIGSLQKKHIVLGVLLVCGIFFLSPSAFAADAPQSTNDILKKLLDVLVMIMTALYAVLVPVIGLIGKLLSNDWVIGSFSGLDNVIGELWVIVRNLVNILFVGILLVVAFIHVLPKDDKGSYALKQMLPRLVVAVIAVNFSLFGCRMIIDASSIMTTAVFSIPNSVTQFETPGMDNFFTWRDDGGSLARDGANECLRTNYYLHLDQKSSSSATGNQQAANGNTAAVGPKTYKGPLIPVKLCGGKGDTKPADGVWNVELNSFSSTGTASGMKYYCEGDSYSQIESNSNDPAVSGQCVSSFDQLVFSERNAMYAFAFGLLRIPSYNKVLQQSVTVDRFFLSTLISLIMLLVIMVTIYAMGVALLIRSVLLWVLMVASPLWVLDLVFSGGGPFSKISEKVSVKSFVGAAFMPVAVGGVLSITFMVLIALKAGMATMGTSQNVISLGGVNLLFGENPLFGGLGSIQDFIFNLVVIVALWMGVFAALKVGDVTGLVAKSLSGVEELGKRFGTLGAQIPMSAPIIPTPFGMMSGRGLMDAGRATANKVEDVYKDASGSNIQDTIGKTFPWMNTKQLSKQDQDNLSTLRDSKKPYDLLDVAIKLDAPLQNNKDVGGQLAKYIDQNKDLKAMLTTPELKGIYEKIKAGTANAKDWETFIKAMDSKGLLKGGKSKQEYIDAIKNKLNAKDTTPKTSDGGKTQKITSNVTINGNKVTSGTNEITKSEYDKVKSKLEKVQLDPNLLTDNFVKALSRNETDASAAAKALKAAGVAKADLAKIEPVFYPGKLSEMETAWDSAPAPSGT